MEPTLPLEPIRSIEPGPPANRPGGIRRSVATLALSLGLLVVGGTAVVLAASPDPSTSGTPTTSVAPSTDGSTTADPPVRTPGRGDKADCPEGAGPDTGGDAGGSDGTDGSTPSTDPSTAPSTAPSADPSVEPTQVPAATPAT